MEEKNITRILEIVIVVLLISIFGAYQVGVKVGSKNMLNGNVPLPNNIPITNGAPTVNGINIGARVVSGTVEKINGDEITIKTFRVSQTESKSVEQIVVVNQETVIEKLIQKDSAVFNKEQTAFVENMKKMQSSGEIPTNIIPPEPFTREKATIGDIKTGAMIMVIAKQDDSKSNKIMAEKISIQSNIQVSPK